MFISSPLECLSCMVINSGLSSLAYVNPSHTLEHRGNDGPLTRTNRATGTRNHNRLQVCRLCTGKAAET